MKKPVSSQWQSLKGNGHKLKCRKFHSNTIKIFFKGGQKWNRLCSELA